MRSRVLRIRIDLLHHELLLSEDPVIGEDPEFVIARMHEAYPSEIKHQLMCIEGAWDTHFLGHFAFADHGVALKVHELQPELIAALRIRQFDIDRHREMRARKSRGADILENTDQAFFIGIALRDHIITDEHCVGLGRG